MGNEYIIKYILDGLTKEGEYVEPAAERAPEQRAVHEQERAGSGTKGEREEDAGGLADGDFENFVPEEKCLGWGDCIWVDVDIMSGKMKVKGSSPILDYTYLNVVNLSDPDNSSSF